MTIPVERVYRSIGVTDAVDTRNRDVLAMTLLLRHIDRALAVGVDEWDELARVGAGIVGSIARDSHGDATEQVLLAQALHDTRAWLRTTGRAPHEHLARADAHLPRAAARVRVRTVIRGL